LLKFMEWADADLHEEVNLPKAENFSDPFFQGTAIVMRLAHAAYKRKDYNTALALARDIAAPDWRRACVMWLDRRWERHARKA